MKSYAEIGDAYLLDMAARIIQEHHEHLIDARIRYVWWEQDPPPAKAKRSILGKATRPAGAIAALTRADFLVQINCDEWAKMDGDRRAALLDHELSHCGWDQNRGWAIVKHDLEDFCAVIERHGAWTDTHEAIQLAFEFRAPTKETT